MQSGWDEATMGPGYWETMIDRGFAVEDDDEQMEEAAADATNIKTTRLTPTRVIVDVEGSSTGSTDDHVNATAQVTGVAGVKRQNKRSSPHCAGDSKSSYLDVYPGLTKYLCKILK